MTLLIESPSNRAPSLAARSKVRLVAAGPRLWRVLDGAGRVIGHLQEVADADGTRFRARRLHPAAHTFRDLGDFWSADDAVECLRLSR